MSKKTLGYVKMSLSKQILQYVGGKILKRALENMSKEARGFFGK
jgi:hypothetical protein